MGDAVSNAMNALRLMTRRNLCSAVPRASDKWVNVTFINQNNGERWPVVGLEGQTLLSVALANKIGVRGGTDRASHVKIAREFEEVVRLADEIILTSAMNGMNVAVPVPEGPNELP